MTRRPVPNPPPMPTILDTIKRGGLSFRVIFRSAKLSNPVDEFHAEVFAEAGITGRCVGAKLGPTLWAAYVDFLAVEKIEKARAKR